jgi:hypothetical protein
MTTVRELHNQAMRLSDRSVFSRHMGNIDESLDYARQALELERAAADQVPKRIESEPTRSVLYRSAATLAFEAEDYAEASRLTAEGLSGFPSSEVRSELYELFERVKFSERQGFSDDILTSASIELTLSGNDISYGVVPFDILRERVTALVDLYRRNSERMMEYTFRGGGPQPKSNPFQSFVRTFQPGSFKVSVELGYKRDQTMSYLLSNDDVVTNVMQGIRLVHDQDWDGLAQMIPEPQYFENFATLVRSLAPDGQRVSLVGLVHKSGSIAYSRIRTEHRSPNIETLLPPTVGSVDQDMSEREAKYVGELKHFDERDSGKYTMSIVTEEEETISFSYSVSMIDTIRSVLGEPVEVTLQEKGNARSLLTIDPAH